MVTAVQTAPWRRVRLMPVSRLVTRPKNAWEWMPVWLDGDRRLALVSDRGVWWQFRNNRGCWIKKIGPV